MSTRAMASRATLGICLIVGAALVSLTCGGGAGPEAVTGPESTPTLAPVDEGTVVSASEAPEFVDVCHYDAVMDTYSALTVPEPALQPHLDHGDFPREPSDYPCSEGPPSTADCPCFTAEALEAAFSTKGCTDGYRQCQDPLFILKCNTVASNLNLAILTQSQCVLVDETAKDVDDSAQFEACIAELREFDARAGTVTLPPDPLCPFF